jgi:hypothetical protein
MQYKGFIINKTAEGYRLELPRDFENLCFGLFKKVRQAKQTADSWLQAWRLDKYEYRQQAVSPHF